MRQGVTALDAPIEFRTLELTFGDADAGAGTPQKQMRTHPTTPQAKPTRHTEMADVPTAYMQKTDDKFRAIDKEMAQIKGLRLGKSLTYALWMVMHHSRRPPLPATSSLQSIMR